MSPVRFVAGLAFLLLACGGTKAPGVARRGPAPVLDASALDAPALDASVLDANAPDAAVNPRPPPLQGDAWIEKITTASGATAYVALPLGAREPRPVVLGVHGAGDHADWSCSEWQATLGGFAWVVCPQGVPMGDAYAWGSAEAIAKQAEEALLVVRSRWGAYVAEGPMIYGGWSQGGTLTSAVVAAHPGMFNRAVIVEAGHTPLSAEAVAFGLARGGVDRVLVSCSSSPCRTFATQMGPAAKKYRLALQVNDVGLRGHWFDGPVFRTLGDRMPWLVEGDARYTGLEAALAARQIAE